ncbi:MAG: hypothetical protein AABX70_08415 [Nanoarchaeota archaeon]
MDRIAIPTKDRPLELNRLLEELSIQFAKYSHGMPIQIFDHSEKGTAKAVIEKFQKQLPIVWVGPEQRNALIKGVAGSLCIDPKEVHDIFSEGYGGNRNFMLACNPTGRVVTVDDDVVPCSFKLREEPRVENPRLEDLLEQGDQVALQRFLRIAMLNGVEVAYEMEVRPEQAVEFQYDFISDLLTPLGKELDANVASGESCQKVTVTPGTKKLILEGRPVTGKVLMVFPLISYHGDMRAALLAKNTLEAYAHTRPFALKESIGSYTSYAALHDVTSGIPFMSTSLRCEDVLHAHMISRIRDGVYFYTGRDVMHKRAARVLNEADLAMNEVASGSFMGIVGMGLRDHRLEDLPSYLLEVSSSIPIIGEYILSARDILANLQYENLPDLDQTVQIFLRVQQEVRKAVVTLHHWPRIHEYVLEQADKRDS